MVGLEIGGKPIEEYAPDFWLISEKGGGKPVGYITSPWYHPEKKQNIAMGYVPYEGNLNPKGFPIGNFGKKYKVHLPKKYSSKPVDAKVVIVPPSILSPDTSLSNRSLFLVDNFSNVSFNFFSVHAIISSAEFFESTT